MDNDICLSTLFMDGNGRWAKKQGMMRAFGHENGTNRYKPLWRKLRQNGH
jgi:undecaprenyl diphosphate synthase